MAKITRIEANEQLSALIDRVDAGEEIVVTRRGRPAVRIVPAGEVGGQKPSGPGAVHLAALRGTLLPLRKSSTELLGELRDEGT